ncbi:hypothetical protein ACOSQ2_021562 [Xanthoceras sorbifolium]
MLCFGVLKLRKNSFIHLSKPRDPADLLEWSASFLVPGCVSLVPASSSSWIPPPPGFLKLNSDVAVNLGFPFAGIGCTIKDNLGFVVAASSKPFEGLFSAEVGELLALREGLLLAAGLNLKIEFVEVDAVNVVSGVSDGDFFFSPVGHVVNDIRALYKELGVVSSLAIPRVRNSLAHSLASLALSSKKDQLWLNCKPSVFSSFAL